MATTVTRDCKRCNGTGFYGDRGICGLCGGNGTRTHTRLTAAEKAERANLERRISAAHQTLRHAAKPLGLFRYQVESAFIHLQMHAPERFAKLLDSVEAGRVADTARALVAYFATTN
jgi:hypothetical protein